MEVESGFSVSWSINNQVTTEPSDNPLYFAAGGEPIFRIGFADHQERFNNIPIGRYRTLADANAELKAKTFDSTKDDIVHEYSKYCEKVAFVGISLADSPKPNGTNTLSLITSRIHKEAVNCWGAIKDNDRLWFVLNLIQDSEKENLCYPFITPLVCSYKTVTPPQLAKVIIRDGDKSALERAINYKTAEEAETVELKEEEKAIIFPRLSMYAGRVQNNVTFKGNFQTLVPPTIVLANANMEDRKAELGNASRFEMFVGGRPDLN